MSKNGYADKFFQELLRIDEQTRHRVAEKGCRFCGGRLHQGDYARKPRGGLLAQFGQAYWKRFSLCCGRRGCRRRTTPESVRFLGRRVYLAMVVVLASVAYVQAQAQLHKAQAHQTKLQSARPAKRAGRQASLLTQAAQSVKQETGVPCLTLRRWNLWWQTEFETSRLYQAQRGRFIPSLDLCALPASLLQRFEPGAKDAKEALVRMLGFISPLSTGVSAGWSSEVRVDALHAEDGVFVGDCG